MLRRLCDIASEAGSARLRHATRDPASPTQGDMGQTPYIDAPLVGLPVHMGVQKIPRILSG